MEVTSAVSTSTDTPSISAGVVQDFENFCEKFTATNSVRYENFLEIWKEMRMSLIFAGRQSDQECREVCSCSSWLACFFLQIFACAAFVLRGSLSI